MKGKILVFAKVFTPPSPLSQGGSKNINCISSFLGMLPEKLTPSLLWEKELAHSTCQTIYQIKHSFLSEYLIEQMKIPEVQ
ncbi:hypothetical protein NJ959_25580 [Symplocastrum sp. BBK-W-15]|uniref:Uncharacterized protein n=1 Tax=Limnofasciculus baicalensis BBK-W-15 TaxID=2699891 RepID=A0AAE3KUR9_9CYAN|nr:hypothetical protein [Limnofasciculus baicalensis BBK-W-15]